MKTKALALSCLAVAGCGSPSTGSVDLFIASMATQQCAWEFRCCTDAEIQEQDGHKFANQNDCVPYRQLALEDELYVSKLAVQQGKLKLDDAKAQACLAQLMSQACNPKTTTNPNPNPMPGMTMDACANVFDGVTAIGQPCEFAGECVAGAHCVSDMLTPGSGVCVPYQQMGQICNDSTDCDPSVQPALYCAQQDFKCHVRSPVGGPCAYTLDAAMQPELPLLLECDNTAGNVYCDPLSNTCKALPTTGQPCLTNLPPGVAYACDPNPMLHLVCQAMPGSTTGICQGPAQLNQACSQLITCDTGLYCDPQANVCKMLPTLGQSCETVGQCAMPYFCNFQKQPPTCDQPAQAGQSCANGSVCDVNLYCDDMTSPTMPVCRPLLADGSMCTSSAQCRSQLCEINAMNQRVCAPSPPPQVMCTGR